LTTKQDLPISKVSFRKIAIDKLTNLDCRLDRLVVTNVIMAIFGVGWLFVFLTIMYLNSSNPVKPTIITQKTPLVYCWVTMYDLQYPHIGVTKSIRVPTVDACPDGSEGVSVE